MQPVRVLKLGALVVGVGASLAVASCGSSRSRVPSSGTGPMADLTNRLMNSLHPEGYRGPQQLRLDRDSVRRVERPDGSLQGTYDGTRLLQAADSHAYGTPTIIDAAADKRGDGIATFNEVRHVVQSFDVDGNLTLDSDEARAFESATQYRWIPGAS